MTAEQRLEKFGRLKPRIDSTAWVSKHAWVDGDVVLGPRCSVFPMAVVRGDINSIRIGEGSNIQDGTIVHLADKFGVEIGKHVTVGHAAIVHACTIEDNCLIGMGATILDGAVIGEGSIIGARALVPMGAEIPPRSLVVGIPGKVVRPLRPDEVGMGADLAKKYETVAAFHRCREEAKSS